jgi:hypothetical protein
MKILDNFLNGEILELDLKKYIKKEKVSLLKIILKKIIRLNYKFFQRIFINPVVRGYFIKIEKFLYKKKLTNEEINKLYYENLLNKDFTYFENLFNEEEVNKLNNLFINEENLIGVYSSHNNFSATNPPKEARMGYIPTEKIISHEFILKAANNKNLINLIEKYFDAKITLDWIWAWWSFKSDKMDHGPQNFHRDYESFNFVKVFVYLTDVLDDLDGCHEFIIGSCNNNNFYKRERFDKNDIINYYKNNVLKIYGKKGTTFIANTFGIHRGIKPIKNNRLILCILYSIIPSNRSPKIPPIYLSKLNNKEIFIKNQYLNRLFINFKK